MINSLPSHPQLNARRTRPSGRLFPGLGRTSLAVLLSGLAVLAVCSYIGGTSWAQPTMSVAFGAAAQPMVSGVAKVGTTTGAGEVSGASSARVSGAKVKLVFRDVKGRAIKTVSVRADKLGRYAVHVPKGARKVSVTITEPKGPKRSVKTTIVLKPGKSAALTAVFPPRSSGILPGIFPY